MGVGEDLRALANSIIDSYELRVRTVSALINQAYQLLKSFETEIEDMIAGLRDNLAGVESLRKKDFDHMISDVIERRRQREEEAEQTLKRFREEEGEMISRLREIVLRGNSSSLEDNIKAIKEDIFKRQKEREKKIIKTLQCFQIEQEELRVALKKLLSKGEGVKIRDLRITLRSLRTRQSDRDAELIKMLEEFEVVRGKVQTQWQTVERVSG
ncbi:MAG: hypothetical protein KKF01_01080 [Proteobacteria bacterium]|nr:hypothetical protein [Pseudomonadota bacterium]